MLELLIATGNPGKVREFRDMLGNDRFAWSDLSQHPQLPPAEETGRTFRANACLKASYYARCLKTWALADDSGLEVDALGGMPGVHSARWAQIHNAGSGDADNNRLLLEQLAGVEDAKRTARFVCVLALADPSGNIILTARDRVEGTILHARVETTASATTRCSTSPSSARPPQNCPPIRNTRSATAAGPSAGCAP